MEQIKHFHLSHVNSYQILIPQNHFKSFLSTLLSKSPLKAFHPIRSAFNINKPIKPQNSIPYHLKSIPIPFYRFIDSFNKNIDLIKFKN